MISEGRNTLTHAHWGIFGTSASVPLIYMSKLRVQGFFKRLLLKLKSKFPPWPLIFMRRNYFTLGSEDADDGEK